MRRSLFVVLSLLALSGCAAEEAPPEQASVTLGPVDGRGLPGSDLERVRAGDPAPDFSLVSLAGPVVTLSELRGSKNVVLVFYRGWW